MPQFHEVGPDTKPNFGEPMKRNVLAVQALCLLLLLTAPLRAQETRPSAAPSLLTVDSILTYRTKSLGPVRWTADGRGYLALEPSTTKKDVVDIVRYDVTSGNRTILVPAEKLAPAGGSAPLLVKEFDLSQDEQNLLIFPNSQPASRSTPPSTHLDSNPNTADL